jgi:hypothetical protein
MLAFQTREGIVTKLGYWKGSAMSALGQKQTFAMQTVMSALPSKATFAAHPDGVGASTCCSSITRAGGALCVADIGRKLASRAMLNMAIAVWRRKPRRVSELTPPHLNCPAFNDKSMIRHDYGFSHETEVEMAG